MATALADGAFELDELLDAELTAVRLEGVVDLFFGERRQFRLQIESSFMIRTAEKEDGVKVEFRPYEDGWVPLGMTQLALLYRSAVTIAHAGSNGSLRIALSNGCTIEVPPDPRFEGWNFYSPEGNLGQTAGGGLFYFPGNFGGQDTLTTEQAYESAYRFVAQYYERERILPLMLMLTAMRPTSDQYKTNDPASWSDWEQCVRESLSEISFPELSPLKK